MQTALQEHWSEPRYEETLGQRVSILFKEGRFDEVGAGLQWLIGWGKAEHQQRPETLWNVGRSPLRTVLHILERSAVSVNGGRLFSLKAAIGAELSSSILRRIAVAVDSSTPPDILRWLAADDDSEVRMRVAENANTPAETLARLDADDTVVQLTTGDPGYAS